LAPPENIELPADLGENVEPLSKRLEYEGKFGPAVHYVFGDTVLSSSQKSAFLASLKGIRAVALTGDLYEPGGGMETGYFRQPYDISKLILSGRIVDQLKNTLNSLEKLAAKTENDLTRIGEEVIERTRNAAEIKNLIRSTEKEIESFTQSLDRARRLIEESTSRIDQIEHEVGTERAILKASTVQKDMIQAILKQHEQTHGSLKLHSQSAMLLQIENDHSGLVTELNDLVKRRMETESKIKSLESAIAVIEPSLEQASIQSTSIDGQMQEFTSNLTSTQSELSKYENELTRLESSRNELTEQLGEVRVKRGEYEAKMKESESEITIILDRLDPLNNELANLNASHKHLQMQTEFHMNELKELGYAERLDVTEEDMRTVEETLPILKKELAVIGGVNELAVSQYEEVKDNYKHLASRIYDLEKEKLSIVQFMNELDQQKFEVFMKAFNQVSQSFNEIFQTVTGGIGRLFLEKPESPFEGGADIRLQFPGKTEMTIGSASGGEKSVGTVCFILALQAIHPMPFYMMDEIDAHLDIVNSQRLAELLKSKSKGSQFIIVSLKDVTITRADSVYGVFIQEGVSQVVALPMQEVKPVGRTK